MVFTELIYCIVRVGVCSYRPEVEQKEVEKKNKTKQKKQKKQ